MVECLDIVGYASNLVNLVIFYRVNRKFSISNIDIIRLGLLSFTSFASCPSYGEQE